MEFQSTQPCKCSFAEVALSDICPDRDFLLRYLPEDARLIDLVRNFGLLNPLFVVKCDRKANSNGHYLIISGFRRFFAASELALETVPVLYVQDGVLKSKELFEIALFLNEPSRFHDLDRAMIVKKAIDEFGFEWHDLERWAGFFGLEPSRKVLEDYYAIGKMPEPFLKEIHSGKIPIKGARSLAELDHESQELLLRELFQKCDFSASESQEVIEWLLDLSKREVYSRPNEAKFSLGALLCDKAISDILLSCSMKPKEKGTKIHRWLRILRFPLFSRAEARFQKIARKIESEKGVSLQRPPFFEENSFTLSLKINSLDRLRYLINELQRNEALFKELFDLVE